VILANCLGLNTTSPGRIQHTVEHKDCAFGIDHCKQYGQGVIRIPIIRCNLPCEDNCQYYVVPVLPGIY